MCVCVRERERERENSMMHVCVRAALAINALSLFIGVYLLWALEHGRLSEHWPIGDGTPCPTHTHRRLLIIQGHYRPLTIAPVIWFISAPIFTDNTQQPISIECMGMMAGNRENRRQMVY